METNIIVGDYHNRFRQKRNRTFAVITLLREYGAKNIITSISSKEYIMSTVKNYNALGVSDSFVSRLDGCSMFLGLLELGVFAREGIQRACKITMLGG